MNQDELRILRSLLEPIQKLTGLLLGAQELIFKQLKEHDKQIYTLRRTVYGEIPGENASEASDGTDVPREGGQSQENDGSDVVETTGGGVRRPQESQGSD